MGAAAPGLSTLYPNISPKNKKLIPIKANKINQSHQEYIDRYNRHELKQLASKTSERSALLN